jgi:hypothetical protein
MNIRNIKKTRRKMLWFAILLGIILLLNFYVESTSNEKIYSSNAQIIEPEVIASNLNLNSSVCHPRMSHNVKHPGIHVFCAGKDSTDVIEIARSIKSVIFGDSSKPTCYKGDIYTAQLAVQTEFSPTDFSKDKTKFYKNMDSIITAFLNEGFAVHLLLPIHYKPIDGFAGKNWSSESWPSASFFCPYQPSRNADSLYDTLFKEFHEPVIEHLVENGLAEEISVIYVFNEFDYEKPIHPHEDWGGCADRRLCRNEALAWTTARGLESAREASQGKVPIGTKFVRFDRYFSAYYRYAGTDQLAYILRDVMEPNGDVVGYDAYWGAGNKFDTTNYYRLSKFFDLSLFSDGRFEIAEYARGCNGRPCDFESGYRTSHQELRKIVSVWDASRGFNLFAFNATDYPHGCYAIYDEATASYCPEGKKELRGIWEQIKAITESDTPSPCCTSSAPPYIERFVLNNGASVTTNKNVTLDNDCQGNPTHYKVSTHPKLKGADWQEYSSPIIFPLKGEYGIKWVYFRVRNDYGESVTMSDSIRLIPESRISLSIVGPSSVEENSNANYYNVKFKNADGKINWVTDDVSWIVDSSAYAYMVGNQLFAQEVSSDQTVKITANYSYNGSMISTDKTVQIQNIDGGEEPTLVGLNVFGPDRVDENSYADYSAVAVFSDGSTQPVSDLVDWIESSSYCYWDSSIKYRLRSIEVPSNQSVIVSARYSYNGVTITGSQAITILDKTPSKVLTSLSISGPSSVNENSYAYYTATAYFSDGSTQNVSSSASWSENSSYTQMNDNQLVTQEVTSDQTVKIAASYSYNGVSKQAERNVVIIDTTPPPQPPFSIVGENPTTNGWSYWDKPLLELSGSIQGTDLIISVKKIGGTPWETSGTVYFKVGSYEPWGFNRKIKYTVADQTIVVTYIHDLSDYAGQYPKEFYVRYEPYGYDPGTGPYAWVGPITVIENSN